MMESDDERDDFVAGVKGAVPLLAMAESEKHGKIRKRPVLIENQKGVDPINVPSKDVMDNNGSLSWDRYLTGQTARPWQHLSDGLLAWAEAFARTALLWPKDILRLFR